MEDDSRKFLQVKWIISKAKKLILVYANSYENIHKKTQTSKAKSYNNSEEETQNYPSLFNEYVAHYQN